MGQSYIELFRIESLGIAKRFHDLIEMVWNKVFQEEKLLDLFI